MEPRDYIILGVVIVLVVSAFAVALRALLSKSNRGQWSEEAAAVANVRAHKWTHHTEISDVVAYLFPGNTAVDLFPVQVANVLAYDAVEQSRGRPQWRSALITADGEVSHLVFALDAPQRSDGAELALPQMVFQVMPGKAGEPNEALSSLARWRFVAGDGDAATELLGSSFGLWLNSLRGVNAVYLTGATLMLEIRHQEFGPAHLGVLERCEETLSVAVPSFPRVYWK